MAGALVGLAFSDTALAYLENVVPQKFRKQIVTKVKTLLQNPHPPRARLVQNASDGQHRVYRVRSGDYRILYSMRPGQIVVLDIDHRKDVYRGTS